VTIEFLESQAASTVSRGLWVFIRLAIRCALSRCSALAGSRTEYSKPKLGGLRPICASAKLGGQINAHAPGVQVPAGQGAHFVRTRPIVLTLTVCQHSTPYSRRGGAKRRAGPIKKLSLPLARTEGRGDASSLCRETSYGTAGFLAEARAGLKIGQSSSKLTWHYRWAGWSKGLPATSADGWFAPGVAVAPAVVAGVLTASSTYMASGFSKSMAIGDCSGPRS
jgi:hypothetical protein